ncbi:MAG: AtpZ/AtpI family protein [Acetivibrio ethanolgignens]
MKKSDKTVLQALTMISQVGITMLVPIFLCVYVGLKLDDWFGTEYLFIVFVLFGVFAAFRNVYLLMRKFYAKDLEREEAELCYFAELKNARDGRRKGQRKKDGSVK